MRIKALLPSLLVLFSLFSCETEVDLFGDSEQVPVVFALLDQSQAVQYFRINPTFVGESDGRVLAGDKTLTNYPDSALDVRLYDLTLSTQDNPVFYRAEETREKTLNDDGIFSPEILMYKLSTPVTIASNGSITNSVLQADHVYQLWFKVKATGKEYKSQILLGDVNDLRMINPPDVPRDRITSHIKFFTGEQYQQYSFQVGRMEGANRYKIEMRYYYTTGTDTVPDSTLNVVNYDIGEVNVTDDASASLTIQFDGERFYQVMSSILDQGIDRHGRLIDFVVTAAGEDLNTYIEVQNATLSGLSQERPSYTNIDNGGIGIFSFRSSRVFKGYYLNSPSANWLVNSFNTYNNGQFKCADFGSTAGSRTVCR
ncbi:MAG: hypothetical protein RIC15_02335 [Vicingaceae bacterium]